ncbi:YbfB/YjiJ family MFS transporter [Micromonospora sp. NPDC023966]|uniref:YbfB/YjiJ family MFS transporter n=1 Tax=Micromonospora sp. NPDC023966 TaxID=3154699 RepID=UPI0033F1B788
MNPATPPPTPWRQIGLALGPAAVLGLGRFAYGLFVPAMSEDLRWTLAEAGRLTTANGVGYLLGAVLAAAVIRRIGLTATFRAGMILTAMSLAATGLGLLLAARAAAGFGGALTFVAGAALATRLATLTGRLTPVAVYFGGAGGGIAITGGAVPILLNAHADRWAAGWWLLAAAAALATVGSWRAAALAPAPVADADRGERRLSRHWRIAASYLLFGAGYIGYLTFLSAYLADRQAPLPLVCVTWILIGVSAMAAPVLWNRPIAAWPGNRALRLMLLGIATAAALAWLVPTPAGMIASALLFGLAFMMVPAAVTTYIGRTVPPHALSATLGVFTVLFAIGQSAGPWVSGVLADRTGAGTTLTVAALLCALAAALVSGRSLAREKCDGAPVTSAAGGAAPVSGRSALLRRGRCAGPGR